MIQNGCKTRIPDHTDFMSCGKIVFKHGYCEEHYNDTCHNLMLVIKKARETEQKAFQDLKNLDFAHKKCIYKIKIDYEYNQGENCDKEVVFGEYCDLHKEMTRALLLERINTQKSSLSKIEQELKDLDKWTL